MNPRGVTLVEILAAVSIMVVVTALSLPAIHSRLAGAKIDAAQGQLDAVIISTRAEAVKRGESIELFARAGKEGTELLARTVAQSRSPGTESSDRDQSRRRLSATLLGVLPKGVELNVRVPSAPRGADEETGPPEVRIAVFCPDGTAVAGGCILKDVSIQFDVTVGTWVGGASFSQPRKPLEAAEDRPGGAV